MASYALRRVLWTIPVLVGITLILFIIVDLLPGDPARALTGGRTPSAQSLANLNERLEAGRPVHRQYFGYLGGVARGDLGTSFRTQRPVADIIAETLPNSLKLAGWALALELLIGIPAGTLAALKKDSLFDRASLVICTLLIAAPVFVLGMGAQLIFGLRLGWLPVAGFGDGSLQFYIMPATVMALIAGSYLARVVRSSLLDTLSQDYVTAARANGLPESRVVGLHALKNALPPVVAVAALHFGYLMGSAVATEAVFDWPGLGGRLFAAVLERDHPLIVGATLVLAALFIAINLAADLIHAWLNPKARPAARLGGRAG
jgi:ABC-type dipeptide/oligopeptide/nickel transport system permease component